MPAPGRLGRNVYVLALVSFFTDVSSEMIYPLLPIFLTTTLGAGAAFLGVVEGIAETTASLLKLASGWWSDRVRRRKPLVVLGYGLAGATRPLMALATSGAQVLAVRVVDRVGKGIRGAPRDALIADSVDTSVRGRAFGFHRAADHAGAVVGPLVAFALLQWMELPLRSVFWLAAIPGAVALAVAVIGVREAGAHAAAPAGAVSTRAAEPDLPSAPREAVGLGRPFWGTMAAILLFTLGNSTDAFLLLRAGQLGVPTAMLPILWAFLHVVKSAASTHGGALSDRIGRLPTLFLGWGIFAAVYLGFAFASAAWHVWALFAVYGLFFALTEGTERALVADIVPSEQRGTAFGWFHLVVGIGALPASVVFGLVWEAAGARAAFTMGAGIAVLAGLTLAGVARGRTARGGR